MNVITQQFFSAWSRTPEGNIFGLVISGAIAILAIAFIAGFWFGKNIPQSCWTLDRFADAIRTGKKNSRKIAALQRDWTTDEVWEKLQGIVSDVAGVGVESVDREFSLI